LKIVRTVSEMCVVYIHVMVNRMGLLFGDSVVFVCWYRI